MSIVGRFRIFLIVWTLLMMRGVIIWFVLRWDLFGLSN
jgi:hypothetical protein